MSGTHVAFLRGINVARAKRVAMADLRALVEGLGCRDVRTVLNSGNVTFTVPKGDRGADAAGIAARIREGLRERVGVSANVIVLTAEELDAIVRENPLLDNADNPSRLFVGVLEDPSESGRLRPLAERDWSPEAIAVGTRAAFLWCPGGFMESPLREAFDRLVGDRATTRNWATIQKVQGLLST